ncbi:MAG: hypothetical protein ABI895_33600 [Deltaproteobacteria bacterium]
MTGGAPEAEIARVEIAAPPDGRAPRESGGAFRLLRTTVSGLLLPTAIGLAYALAVLFREQIKVGGGLGWDGILYGKWARDFPAVLRDGVDAYYAQRVLPSGVAYAGLRLLDLKATNPAIIKAFEIANVVLVSLSAWSYDVTARRLAISARSRWVGAIGLFGSFAILKFSVFDPVLTDVWAFAFGMFQLQFCLTGRPLCLALVTALGAFAWPTLLPVGCCLLFFPVFHPTPGSSAVTAQPPAPRAGLDAPISGRAPARLNEAVAWLLVAVWIWLCWPMARDGHSLGNSTGWIELNVVAVSVAVSAAYLFVGTRALLDDRRWFDLRWQLRAAWSPRAALAIVLFVGITLLRMRITSRASLYGLDSNIEMTVFSAIKEPAIFALAHVLYWGPLLVLMLLGWRRVVATIQRSGPGVTLVALMALLLSLNGESRKLGNFAPLFYVFALPLLDELRMSARKAWLLVLLSLSFSRVWITFDGKMKGDLAQFPGQMLYMVMGPWMNPSMYVLQGTLVLALLGGLWLLFFRVPRAPRALLRRVNR